MQRRQKDNEELCDDAARKSFLNGLIRGGYEKRVLTHYNELISLERKAMYEIDTSRFADTKRSLGARRPNYTTTLQTATGAWRADSGPLSM